MSHKKTYRKDKTCLNCRFVVDQKFCPNCGQENTDTRKSFHHLFIHFFEDLTHYENAFWRTIKNLLFKPSALTKEYLSGKRLSYLAPVRLYIFISFLTFFILSQVPNESIKPKIILTDTSKNESKSPENEFYNYDQDSSARYSTAKEVKKNVVSEGEKELNDILKSKEISDSAKIKLKEILLLAKKDLKEKKDEFDFGYKTIAALDAAKADGKINGSTYFFLKKGLILTKNNTNEEIIEKALESAQHNFPKVLLIYMPIFAFFLWVFHNKKKWFYFDHGIFTLHYFSFLLLTYLLIFVLTSLLELFVENAFLNFVIKTIQIVGFCWMFYYFFPAHHRFYGESRRRSFVKSMLLFFINMFLVIFMMVFFFLYTMVSIA